MGKLRAIDLYSGVGGWSLGLRLAGIEVVASYERWGPANETNFKNNLHQAQTVDIRRLALADLPRDIDIVVGSPPCTQFSFSNRGGGGDISDGLKDIKCFLTIVDHLKPKFWAMENVPRVAKIIQQELEVGGALEEFSHLGCHPHIINMADYGLPQRRRRNICGNFDIARLESYKTISTPLSLGEVIKSLEEKPIVDPLFGVTMSADKLTDHIVEDVLNEEETRINRANKTTHTIYNAMAFPDPLDRTVRTITATCTRVSRESIVIPASKGGHEYRRLTLRERACLQGFPVTFQFYGSSYSQKLRMIGNAVPPVFAYFVAHAMQDNLAEIVAPLSQAGRTLKKPEFDPAITPTDRAGARYPTNRNFKFAIPSLQLKSGVRFEFRNERSFPDIKWAVAFYFGNSKSIETISLDSDLKLMLEKSMSNELIEAIQRPLRDLSSFIGLADIVNLQAVWAHKGPGGTRPFMMLDKMDEIGVQLIDVIKDYEDEARKLVLLVLAYEFSEDHDALPGVAKLERNAAIILGGLLLGSLVNPLMEARQTENVRNRVFTALGD